MPRAGDSSVIPHKATCEGLLSQISFIRGAVRRNSDCWPAMSSREVP
jgi:hypothetical protein